MGRLSKDQGDPLLKKMEEDKNRSPCSACVGLVIVEASRPGVQKGASAEEGRGSPQLCRDLVTLSGTKSLHSNGCSVQGNIYHVLLYWGSLGTGWMALE